MSTERLRDQVVVADQKIRQGAGVVQVKADGLTPDTAAVLSILKQVSPEKKFVVTGNGPVVTIWPWNFAPQALRTA